MATPSKPSPSNPVRIIPPLDLDVDAVVREMLDIRLSPDDVEALRPGAEPGTRTRTPRSKPSDKSVPQPADRVGGRVVRRSRSAAEILRPLDGIFLDPRLLDDLIQHASIPDLLAGQQPSYSGVILYGPPGTGKTVLLRALGSIYNAAGAYACEVSVTQLNNSFVGEFAKAIEKRFELALREADRLKRPSLLYFDEATILAQAPSEGATSVAKHYQEAMDVMKRYIGNYPNLVVAISTNLPVEEFDPALIREGRLTSFLIDYPDAVQRARMWAHFTRKHNILELAPEQADELAASIPYEQGAFIEEFCRNYLRTRHSALLRQAGHATLLDALKNNAQLPDSEVSQSVNYDTLVEDLIAAIESRAQRLAGREEAKALPIGFGLRPDSPPEKQENL